jgi:hypothetical protein
MSANSGLEGVCEKCLHVNNEHNVWPCEAPGCENEFKVCQTGNHRGVSKRHYVLCEACPDHPYSCTNVEIHKIKRLK